MELYKPFYDKFVTPAQYKYSVLVIKNHKPKLIHFGNRNYQHYHDKIGIWNELDHFDGQRRNNYLSRSKGIRDGNGNLTYNNKNSSNYWARNILW